MKRLQILFCPPESAEDDMICDEEADFEWRHILPRPKNARALALGEHLWGDLYYIDVYTNKESDVEFTFMISASLLRIAYYDEGPQDAQTVILMHGFPHDINSFAEVAPQLVEKGYLRGYGGTQFFNESTPRSAEQAALGYDLLTLMEALEINHAILAGFDWGTIPVNVVAALWPERCDGMVAVGSYPRVPDPGPAHGVGPLRPGLRSSKVVLLPVPHTKGVCCPGDAAEGVYAGHLG